MILAHENRGGYLFGQQHLEANSLKKVSEPMYVIDMQKFDESSNVKQ